MLRSTFGSRRPRRLAALMLFAAAAAAPRAEGSTGAVRGASARGPDRRFDFIHLELRVTLDPAEKSLSGEAIYTLTALREPQMQVRLDARELILDGAAAAGQSIPARATEDEFILDLPRAYAPGEMLEVRVKYHGRPRKGIFFYGPDGSDPGRPVSIWTHGEPEDNHFWFPCYDYPDDKLTSSTRVTLPSKYVAISNGKLLETKRNRDGTSTWIWSESVKHSTYLLSFVAGDYETFHQEWRGMDVDAWVPRGRLAEAERSFGMTPEMLEFFSTLTGVKYPYEKFSQEVVPEFIHVAMENISAVTHTDSVLHPAHLDEEENSEEVVAHELAHQWFGDLVTSRDWANLWLHEGFATYFEALWTEHRLGEDDFLWEMERRRRDGVHAARRLPLVTVALASSSELFERPVSAKGAWVLHMLRRELGDAVFFAGIKKYLERFRESNADTGDFQRTMSEASGRDLRPFFDQWVFRPGHPELEVSWRYNDALGAGRLSVKQLQKTDGGGVFRFSLPVEILYDEGSERRTVKVDEMSSVFTLKTKSRPAAVLIDPDGDLLKTVSGDFDERALRAIVARAGNPVRRAEAAELLGGAPPTGAGRLALKKALRADSFWGVRAAAAAGLSKYRDADAQDEILRALTVEKSGRARSKMAGALGRFRVVPELVLALKRIAASDVSDYVRASALQSLGATGTEYEFLKSQAAGDSHRQIIRETVFSIWGERGERRAIPMLLGATRPNLEPEVPAAAARALGALGKNLDDPIRKKQIRERLVEMIDAPRLIVRSAAIRALGDLGDPAALPALEAASTRMWDSRQRRDAAQAVEKIVGQAGRPQ
jgi:aminopeptidase N